MRSKGVLVPSRLRREPDLVRVIAFIRYDYASSDNWRRVILMPFLPTNRLLYELLSHVFLGLSCRGVDLSAEDVVLRGVPGIQPDCILYLLMVVGLCAILTKESFL